MTMPQDLISSAINALPKNSPAQARKFLESLFSFIGDDDREILDPVTLAHVALKHLELGGKRRPGETAIAVYTPNLDEGDWAICRTIVDVAIDDMSFLVDSVAAEVNRHGHLIYILLHPVIDGVAHIHLQLQGTITKEEAGLLENDLRTVLSDVRLATRDWRDMLGKLSEAATRVETGPASVPESDRAEYKAFLEFIGDANFTFLGYQAYDYDSRQKTAVPVKGSGLGLLSEERAEPYISGAEEGLPAKAPAKTSKPVGIAKTKKRANVHRSVPMDVIKVRHRNENGIITGEEVFVGLFTSSAYSRSVSTIPLFRRKVARVIDSAGFAEASHDRRALRHILEKYPRDELFQIETERLKKIALGILRLQERQKIALYTRNDRLGRYVSCLVYVPRDRYDTGTRLRFQRILEQELNGECNAFYTSLDDSVFARVLFMIDVSARKRVEYDEREIELLLQTAGRTWTEQLGEALSNSIDNERKSTRLASRYGHAFPSGYCESYQPFQAVCDIFKIEEVLETGEIALDLYRQQEQPENHLRLKVYVPGAALNLSDALPLLENMGLRVLSELPFEVMPADATDGVWIHDFGLELRVVPEGFRLRDIKDTFEDALRRIWYGSVENDGINRLVLAGIDWRETTIIRAYIRYMRQMRMPYSLRFMERTIAENPRIARLLLDLFIAWHDPLGGDQNEIKAAGCGVAIDHELEKVASLDQDRILRTIASLIEATMRTNFFQPDEHGNPKPYLSLKLDSRKIADLPEPKPFMEIFVYSPRVEGVHLRGDRIARGGLRWSDRHEDFRTEVLGLMKAQMVKNAVIIPMGAKGGFVAKQPPKESGREAVQAEGIECYKLFISGLLDITDNRVGDRIVPPRNVVRRDEDDPYLVVAADKGTATFSDIANTLSHQYGFWLGDAFASGGSTGYDHKAMGITARGAWESVKRHFREVGHDTQTQPFDVIGVGDMSGDVFGNGMLLSEHIRLVGAFNHLHIVCDPTPDPAKTFKERLRLFTEVKGWDAYNTKLLSRGGRIYARSEKSLLLTPEIKERFGLARDRVTPIELIRALLKAKTDLLWFGGIGTYIKAGSESHADVGDKANDSLRINADEVNAKVIGEGANLAITQLGRIEFALHGGAINTDFIDNSGGVDTSDHEVNIKILLNAVMANKEHRLSVGARNNLLEKMADEVAQMVLRNNYQQAMALSLTEMQSTEHFAIQTEFIRDLEREQGVKRALEGLPDEEEIKKRRQAGKGLTRPELAVLLSYAKITFTKDLMASTIPDNPDMIGWLYEYFPERLRGKYAQEIAAHRLHREIISTVLANGLVNRLGPTFVKSTMIRTGATCEEVAKAYIITREAFDLRAIWDEIEILDASVPAKVQLRALRDVMHLTQTGIKWLLTRMGRDLDISNDTPIFREGLGAIQDNIDALVTEDTRDAIRLRTSEGVSDGLAEPLARRIAMLPAMASAFDIIRIASENNTDIALTARTYFELGELFHIDWLRRKARTMHADDRWTSDALSAMIDQLYTCQAGLTIRILHDTDMDDMTDGSIVRKWLDGHQHQAKQIEPLFAEMRRAASIDLSMLIIAEQRLRALYGG
ncbi:MAG: NAD-glutamate dehydrogenase [Alphaproteobacteria bacterium]|nr:NAD-glutamate dehydrogenase [Alphaproteobacteria bacterium]